LSYTLFKYYTKLIKRLTTPEELSGLLNLALVGLKQLKDEGGFHDEDIEDIRRDYEEHTNDVNTFLYQECLVDITNPDYYTLATVCSNEFIHLVSMLELDY
jgi:hypothetical protein